MDKFTSLTSLPVPLIAMNVDTDAIIPSREMKQVSKKGLSIGLFAGWRYSNQVTRALDPNFVLNKPEYAGAAILLSGANFGCGSSREHAVWALMEYGFKVIIAPSFSNIFYNNAVRNGLLPIRLDADAINTLEDGPVGENITVDLTKNTITAQNGSEITFTIEPANRDILLHGKDPISQTMEHRDAIDSFIKADKTRRPWARL